MTFVGHGIAGATIAVAVLPRDASVRSIIPTIIAFAVLANLPDAHFPGWGHDRYDISHSVFVTLVLAGVLAVPFFLSTSLCRKVGGC
ncbi:MAG: hypothetical protein GXY83_27880 [Rhodopirellula sp.]|nr:hypothetical protein [Rhodopirellula sp.]